jgi:hypothetical protein
VGEGQHSPKNSAGRLLESLVDVIHGSMNYVVRSNIDIIRSLLTKDEDPPFAELK